MDDLTTVKRLHYFDHQFLREADFTAEQAYHVAQRRLHNRVMHNWGITTGLEVKFASGSTAVTVTPGVAIDGLGREIVVPATQTIELSSHPPSASLCITIAYEEVLSDPPSDEDEGQNHTRYTEQAVFLAASGLPNDPDRRLVLGVVQRDPQKKVTGVQTTDRRSAGVAGGSLDVRELVLGAPAIIDSQWVRMRLRAAGIARLTGALEVTGPINPANGNAPTAGVQFIPTAPSSGDEAFIRYYPVTGEASKLVIGVGNDPDDRLSLMQDDVDRLTIWKGNVGIGTQDPARLLHVEGAEIHVGGATGGLSFADRSAGAFVANPTTGQRWVWYAEGGIARLWSGQPLLTVTPAGVLSTKGGYNCGGDIELGANRKIHGAGDLTLAPEGGLTIVTAAGDGVRIQGAPDPSTYLLYVSGRVGLYGGTELHVGATVFGGAKVYGGMTVEGGCTIKTGDLVVGTLVVKGGKNAYVTDHFVNNLEDSLEQGDVVVVNPNGVVAQYGTANQIPVPEVDLTDQAYDSRVCGIVDTVHGELAEVKPEGQSRSRKKVLEPRIFDADERAEHDAGKVAPGQVGAFVTLGAYAFCKADASIAPIEVGDLLTTSPTKGHAQKVLDREKATGAIIGKALGPLPKGKGKIPVLVTLH